MAKLESRAGIFLIVWLLIIVSGCGRNDTTVEIRKAAKEEIAECKNKGGIPIRSPNAPRLLSDCIFTPLM